MRVHTDCSLGDSLVGLGWIVILDSETHRGRRYITGDFTSMQGEYFAMLDGIRHAHQHSQEYIEVHTDCEPLVKKIHSPYELDDEWEERRQGLERLLEKFELWDVHWSPRESNEEADRLAYEALVDGRQNI